ncbi:MAG: zinc metalloprotease HtpX [Actinomycetota bacterium]|nr:zinc metalloprotease HtpX [Actinomycetota bacterium]
MGINRVKTWVLIAALAGLFVAVGAMFGGRQGATIALGIAFVFNFIMYWSSDRIAIAATRSKPVTEDQAPELYGIVRELAMEAKAPMPRIYVSEMAQPNAFATGRNPGHAAVSVTRGILQILDRRELRGVLAHELSHVLNRDILVSSIASAIGSAFTYLGYIFLFAGGGRDSRNSPLGGMAFLVLWLLAPLAAGIIQMSVSRSREYQADESGALLSQDPEALASALQKLEESSKRVPAQLNPAQAHLFIVNPLRGRQRSSLFSTHPPTAERVRRLMDLRARVQAGGAGSRYVR